MMVAEDIVDGGRVAGRTPGHGFGGDLAKDLDWAATHITEG
jgi:hypothetical protein